MCLPAQGTSPRCEMCENPRQRVGGTLAPEGTAAAMGASVPPQAAPAAGGSARSRDGSAAKRAAASAQRAAGTALAKRRRHGTSTSLHAPPAEEPRPHASASPSADKVVISDGAGSDGGWGPGSADASVRPWAAPQRSWVLLGSGLGSVGKHTLRALASAAGCRVVDKWSSDVTHVVCGASDEGVT